MAEVDQSRRLLIPPEIRRMHDGKLKLFVAGYEIAGVRAIFVSSDNKDDVTAITFNNADIYFQVEKPNMNS